MATKNNLHFLLIPFMSQSHIIPLVDFAKLLSQNNVTISIVTTPLNFKRYNNISNLSNGKIKFIILNFPTQEFGLPQGCENMDSIISHDLFFEFFRASDALQEPLERAISEMEQKPSCIVCTGALSWTQDVATKFDIPRYVFQTVSCFTSVCMRVLKETKVEESVQSDSETFVLPDLPDQVEFTKAQLMEKTIKVSDKLTKIFGKIKDSQDLARGILVNSFEELGTWYVNYYKRHKKNMWCVGPVSLCNKESDEMCNRGNKSSSLAIDCLSWLDTMKQRSVVYACFGSLCQISPSQLREIGLGLEASNAPFIWVIRGLNLSPQVEEWLQEDGFEERVKGRGLVVKGWAPQLAILSHPSVAGFLTHCGWNSTLEGICAGVSMVTFPMFAEQFYNEKFVVDVLKIGVKVGVGVSMNSWDEEEKGVLVKREQVKNAIDSLLCDEVVEMRKRAQELAKMANEAGQQGGSSFLNISLFVQDVIQISEI